jgi:WD40 repeat protein
MTVKIWDVSSGTCVHTLKGHSSYVTSVAFSHDSTWLASASSDMTVKIWDVSSGTCIHTLNVSTALHSLSFDSTSTSLHTNIGMIAIPPFPVSTSTGIAASKPQYQNVSLSLDMVWIVRAGSNILWVPSEYRPSRSAVSGALVGMGVGSGRIWFCEVK